MNGHPTNEDRQALIAGDSTGALEPDEQVELPLLAHLLGDPSTWAEPSAGLEDTVVRAVEGATPLADRSPASTTVKARRQSMTRRRRLTLSAVSAAAAIATVIGTAAVVGSGNPADFTAKLSATATAVAPAARGTADFTKNKAGFEVTLYAKGLPKLTAGEYYQAWLKNPAGILVPIGTFSSSDGKVILWSGVSPKDFRAISVTIEKTDGKQGSSGRRVLAGMVHTR